MLPFQRSRWELPAGTTAIEPAFVSMKPMCWSLHFSDLFFINLTGLGVRVLVEGCVLFRIFLRKPSPFGDGPCRADLSCRRFSEGGSPRGKSGRRLELATSSLARKNSMAVNLLSKGIDRDVYLL
jgi:hypothetical protein